MRTWLKKYRKRKKLSQNRMAQSLQISQQYYGFIENGERQAVLRVDMLVKLAQIFDCSVDELIRMEAKEKEGNGIGA